MAITKLSSTSSSSGLTTAVPAGLGYITETSFAASGISANGTDTANYGGRNATCIVYGDDVWIMFGTKGAHAWSHNGTDWFSGKGPLPINQGRYHLDYITDAVYADNKWVAVTRLVKFILEQISTHGQKEHRHLAQLILIKLHTATDIL